MVPSQFERQDMRASLSRCLAEDRILLRVPSMDKDSLMEMLVRRLCAARSLGDVDSLLAKIRERERSISTTLDSGLSLPHARVEGLSDIAAILAVPASAVRDLQHPAIPIRAMLLFFSPGDPSASQRHLLLLRAVAKLFDPRLIDQLSTAASPAQAWALIRGQEEAL